MAWVVLSGVDKNLMGCFVRGGKLMRDVLFGVLKNGMGCLVPGCFVLHFTKTIQSQRTERRCENLNNCIISDKSIG